MARVRLDQLLVARGLVRSRERARAVIIAGSVTVDGRPITKSGTLVDDQAAIALREPDHPWVSRGGVKLAHALDRFQLVVTGIAAMDIGASTGGFTDVLLERGARRVVALDVGHGQLDWRLRNDPRVHVIEGMNARFLKPDDLPADLRAFDLVTIDVAFISLKHILPVLPPLLAPEARVLALVKPQFEAGRSEVGKGGIVRDPAIHERVLAEVTGAALQVGLHRLGMEPSPIRGAEGNLEFLILFSASF